MTGALVTLIFPPLYFFSFSEMFYNEHKLSLQQQKLNKVCIGFLGLQKQSITLTDRRCLPVLEAEIQEQDGQDWFLLRTVREDLCQASPPTSGGLLAFFGVHNSSIPLCERPAFLGFLSCLRSNNFLK